LEKKINEALQWEFYDINFSNNQNINEIKFENHSKKLEKELLLAINE
jgi:hypothetical protein